MNEWWETFFDQDYLRIWGQVFTVEVNKKQAEELWTLLDLKVGCRHPGCTVRLGQALRSACIARGDGPRRRSFGDSANRSRSTARGIAEGAIAVSEA